MSCLPIVRHFGWNGQAVTLDSDIALNIHKVYVATCRQAPAITSTRS